GAARDSRRTSGHRPWTARGKRGGTAVTAFWVNSVPAWIATAVAARARDEPEERANVPQSRIRQRHRKWWRCAFAAIVPAHRTGRVGLLAGRPDLPGQYREPRGGHERCERIRFLRRTTVRERVAALRSPAHGVRQGCRSAVPDDARQEGGSSVRLGHPRPACRTRSRTAARYHGQVADRR